MEKGGFSFFSSFFFFSSTGFSDVFCVTICNSAIFCFAFLSDGGERWEPHGGGMAWWSADRL